MVQIKSFNNTSPIKGVQVSVNPVNRPPIPKLEVALNIPQNIPKVNGNIHPAKKTAEPTRRPGRPALPPGEKERRLAAKLVAKEEKRRLKALAKAAKESEPKRKPGRPRKDSEAPQSANTIEEIGAMPDPEDLVDPEATITREFKLFHNGVIEPVELELTVEEYLNLKSKGYIDIEGERYSIPTKIMKPAEYAEAINGSAATNTKPTIRAALPAPKEKLKENKADPVSSKQSPEQVLDHAVLSPSSADRWFNCDLSVMPLPEGYIVKETDSQYRDWGTECHAHVKEAFDILWKVYKQHASITDLKTYVASISDDEMAQLTRQCVNQISNVIKSIGLDNIYAFHTESKVKFSEHIWGTLDLAILYVREGQKRRYLWDLKTGKGVTVDAEQNEQLMVYNECSEKTHKWEAEQSTLAIYQPRARDVDFEDTNPGLKQWMFTQENNLEDPDSTVWGSKAFRKALAKREKEIVKLWNLPSVKQAKVHATPGDHCRWCPRAAICTARAESVSVPALVQLSSIEDQIETEVEIDDQGREVAVTTFSGPPPNTLSMEQLSFILEAKEPLKSYLKDVEKYCTNLALIGKFPGYKIVAGRSQSSWIDDKNAVAKYLVKNGVADPFVKKLKNMTEIKSEVPRINLDTVRVKGIGRPKLVPTADPRVALENMAELGPIDMDDYDDD